ncbi:FtsW/RodA/SpoVE family cell cycle protein [Bacillus spongiae]|uniref:FtsW/RodA/SpoVE family cell cycle protein n=1 Tax=Bacillus spongiae TaxID=2683610 RepID=A0ABU8H8F5_9BACI
MQQKKKSYFDVSLLITIIFIMILSLIAISGALEIKPDAPNYFKQQIVWFILGSIVMIAVFIFDFEQIEKLTPYIYGFGIILLIILLIIPMIAPDSDFVPDINGARSWFVFPGGSIQPSEFMKIFLVLMLAFITSKHRKNYTMGKISNDLIYLIKVAVIAGLPIILTNEQNDFGTSLVMIVITLSIIFISGINWMIIIVLICIVLLMISSLVLIFIYKTEWLLYFIDPFQLDRIYAWLKPFHYGSDISFQLQQSILAVGSGTSVGNDINVYIPEAHSDFIFSMIGEDYGFLGASLIVCLYFILIYRILVIGIRQINENIFEVFICAGIIGMLMFHVFQNIGMVIGLIPITGIPLPLLSYGGSSVLATMLGLGLVLNISFQKKHYMFTSDDDY